MTDATTSLERVTDAVGYLRVTVGTAAPDADWLACAELVADPAPLGALARRTAAGRGTDRDDVAMSLLVQGYAFRIASIAVGVWLLDGAVLDVAPAHTAIALGRDRPNAVHLDAARIVPSDGSVAALHAELIDGHLASLVATAHEAVKVGEALLWSNVGASCASAFGAFMEPFPDRRGEIRTRAEEFFAAGRTEVAGSGRLVPVGTEWAWERAACCLWYRTESGFRCADCSLWTEEERAAKYAAAIAAQVDGADAGGSG